MKQIPDTLLLTTAQISATLIGLLLVGVFFYLEAGFHRLADVLPQARPFLRATSKLLVAQYGMVLGLSLGLIALGPVWITVLSVALSLAVVAGLVDWTRSTYRLPRVVRRAVRVRPWMAWPIVLPPLVLPWLLDGWLPGRQAFTLTLLLEGGLAFLNTASVLLLAFDLSAIERAARTNTSASVQSR